MVLLGAAVFAGGNLRLWAQSDEPSGISREHAIKAAYLYQFTRYVQWPDEAFADAASPFTIGLLGEDPFGAVLEEIARSKKVGGRTILIRRFASMTDYAACHILFVPSTANAFQQTDVIKRTQGLPVLLVGETPGFALQGAAVNFYLEDNKVRFEINAEAAKQQQLKISSKLLSLARIVSTAGAGQLKWKQAKPTREAIVRLDAAVRRFDADE